MHLQSLTAHLVYGAMTEVVRRLVRSNPERAVLNNTRNRRNQPPTVEGKKQYAVRDAARKHSEVGQASRRHPELNLGTSVARTGIVAVGLVVAALGAAWIGVRRQHRARAADIERLVAGGAARGVAAPADSHVLERLPPPVARYLRLALPYPKHIQEVRIRQTGTLRTDATSERWMPFDAEHVVVPDVTGFVWDARVKVAPLVHVRVRDALIDGRGSGQVSLMSAFTLSADAGGVEMNSGSLHRYLAEAVWYPTALLPSPALRWTEIDPTRALATLTSHGVTVSLEFRFAENGEVTGIFTPARWGTFPGGYRQVPWEGHFRDYRERDGVVVPAEGDVGWYLDDEWRAVWKGVVVAYEARTRTD